MRIIFITFITPASENIRGTSVLIFDFDQGVSGGALGFAASLVEGR